MELATRAFEALQSHHESRSLLERTLSNIGMSVDRAKTLLRATALLHDVGHLPFSHGGEDILPLAGKGVVTKHEQLSVAIIRGTELSEILEKEFYAGIVAHIALLLEDGEPPLELLILKKLISGQFDADRMDYLSRDSLHCGVGYGNFDYPRLLETLRAKESREGGLELCLERGGIHTLEAMVLARYWMFTQVYYHKVRRIYDIYLSRYLKAWYKDQYSELLRVLDYDDVTVMNQLIEDARGSEDADRRNYATRIVERKHHRVVYETNDRADAHEKRIAIGIERRLRKEERDVDFILDLHAENRVHKFFVKGEEEYGDEFPIYNPISAQFSRLSEESSIFEKIPKNFHVIRIYADVSKNGVARLRNKATQIEQEERRAI
jgi:HD superfamily phosphohydrolase